MEFKKKSFNFRSRRFIAVFLALALTVCLGMATLTGASAVTVNGFDVLGYYRKGSFYSTSALSTGINYYGANFQTSSSFGYRVTLPSNSSASSISISGLDLFIFYPVQTNNVWGIYSPTSITNAIYPGVYYYFSSWDIGLSADGGINGTNQGQSDFSIFDGSPIIVPSHSSTLYLYVFIRSINAGGSPAVRVVNPRIVLEQSPWISLQSTVNSLLTSVNEIKNSIAGGGQQSPMDQFESDYLQNFQSQIQGTEKYLGNGSSVVPDNFVSGSNGQPSVVDSITENIGLSSGALNMTDFANAASSFSGSDSTGEGGMWQFFTQEVADDMATVSGAMFLSDFDIPSDFESELSKWIEDSERRYEKWCNP